MINWLKSRFAKQAKVELSIQERFSQLWKTLVPVGGEAETLQGEILRSVGRLEDEYNRNGNINWEPGDYHCEFVEFLKRHLADRNTFDQTTVQQIRDAAEKVRLAAEDLATKYEDGQEIQVQKHSADAALKFLMERAVEWCDKNPKPIYKPAGQDFWITLE
jgi:hypothetical protein